MKRRLGLVVLLSAAACGDETPPAPGSDGCDTTRLRPGNALVLTTTYETSSLDLLPVACPSAPRRSLVVASGDTALRRSERAAWILNRGSDDNVIVVGEDLTVAAQIGLSGCGPHDAIELADGRVLVSCYDDTALRLVDPRAASATSSASLAAYADADGLPEMDQMAVADAHAYVTLQRLDRARGYVPTGAGSVAEIALPTMVAVRELGLPCANPFTRLVALGDGRLAVGCAGSFAEPGHGAIATLDPTSGLTEVVATEAQLGGAPTALARGPQGELYALVALADPETPFVTTEMRVVRVTGGDVEVLRARPGFVLSGLAVSDDGWVYFGDRTIGSAAGIWRLIPGAVLAGPFATGLPPLEIEL